MDMSIYYAAQILIDRFGDKAAAVAIRRTMRFIRHADVDAAGLWLQIGYAIDEMANPPAASRRH